MSEEIVRIAWLTGIVFAGACGLVFLIMWIMWLLGLGRFKQPEGKAVSARREDIRYMLVQAVVTIIDDFKHLLALIVVLIFAGAVVYVLYHADKPEDVASGLQATVATLGGLVGSIIGYYFGESAASKTSAARAGVGGDTEEEEDQEPPVQPDEPDPLAADPPAALG